jgi:hypothetical protein
VMATIVPDQFMFLMTYKLTRIDGLPGSPILVMSRDEKSVSIYRQTPKCWLA